MKYLTGKEFHYILRNQSLPKGILIKKFWQKGHKKFQNSNKSKKSANLHFPCNLIFPKSPSEKCYQFRTLCQHQEKSFQKKVGIWSLLFYIAKRQKFGASFWLMLIISLLINSPLRNNIVLLYLWVGTQECEFNLWDKSFFSEGYIYFEAKAYCL